MTQLDRFPRVRDFAICSVALFIAAASAPPTASAEKPKLLRDATKSESESRTAEGIKIGWDLLHGLAPEGAEFTIVPATAYEPILPRTAQQQLPLGEWTRSVGTAKQHWTVTPDCIRVNAELNEDGTQYTVQVTADFSVTPDGLVYGVLSDVRLDAAPAAGSSDDAANDDLAELVALQTRLIDQPFSFRVRIVNDAMVVKDVRFAGSGLADDDEVFASVAKLYIAGTYARSKPTAESKP
jgi:hypothetical protein